MMRIAYVCADSGIPIFGQKGCSIHVQEIIRGFLKQDHQVHLLSPRFGDDISDDLQTIKLHELLPIPKVAQGLREKIALSMNSEIEAALDYAEPFDLVYERYSLWSYGGMEYARKKGIPGILEVNSPLILEQQKHRSLVHFQEAKTVAIKVFNAATSIIAVSDEVKNYVSQYVNNPDKIKVIPNGVNAERFHPKKITPHAYFTVGFVGSLKPWHGLPILLDAFEQFHHQYPQSRLLIIGKGPESDRLQTEINQKNLNSVVQLTGPVPPYAIPFLLEQIDVAVAPYPPLDKFYFSPLKVYEYMAAGLPVVASNIGQIRDVIKHGNNGLLCPPGDSNALSEAFIRLMRSPQLRHQLGTSARQTILDHYTWDQVVEKILALAKEAGSREKGEGRKINIKVA
ncbi:glycosyl transferase, group 1 [Crocosphaera subtropica ATCC 51142]|uniref:Glycosyl transferase, group 1 n=2 Tax=Crocosphaera TaxID=263510 RepID=B1WU86_CROS5|nr:glycosyltransferase family 4 protein [Crocosphaera subtropica]ACB52148.1 glycosyl transferase, group 1 [Crocosphaera subtropica ATCC 51142]